MNGYDIFLDEVLGLGQFGTVCKAVFGKDASLESPQFYACKMIKIKEISKEDLECIHNEVRIHSLVQSSNCIRLYQTI